MVEEDHHNISYAKPYEVIADSPVEIGRAKKKSVRKDERNSHTNSTHVTTGKPSNQARIKTNEKNDSRRRAPSSLVSSSPKKQHSHHQRQSCRMIGHQIITQGFPPRKDMHQPKRAPSYSGRCNSKGANVIGRNPVIPTTESKNKSKDRTVAGMAKETEHRMDKSREEIIPRNTKPLTYDISPRPWKTQSRVEGWGAGISKDVLEDMQLMEKYTEEWNGYESSHSPATEFRHIRNTIW